MRKFANMNNAAKVAIAATAVMVAVVGITRLWPSASASATAQPGSSPTAVSVGVASNSRVAGTCAPVTSLMCESRLTLTENGVRFSFRDPTRRPGGWRRLSSISTGKFAGGPISLNKSIVGAQGAEAIIYWTSFPRGDYAHPCVRLLSPSIGASAAKLATAVSRARGTELVKGPSDVTLGWLPAKHVVLTVRKSVGCNPGFFYSWKEVFGGPFWLTTPVGATIRVWIVAVGGTRLVIAAATSEDANPRLKREVKHIVESIRFAQQ
jgi:hypothetical protein